MGSLKTSGVVGVLLVLLLAAAAAPGAGESKKEPSSSAEPDAHDVVTMEVWSVDSGGAESGHGGLTLVGTIGQHDTGVVAQGGLALAGGLWAGEVDADFIFIDGFESGDAVSWSSVVGLNP
jgi:hypothetical protein